MLKINPKLLGEIMDRVAKKIECEECGKYYESINKNTGLDGKLRCKECQRDKRKTNFVQKYGKTYYEKHQKDNIEHRQQQREWTLKNVYGISMDDYNKLLKIQGNLCAICKGPQQRDQNFCVDHCHKTGKIRGLLCHKCNKALGLLNDNYQQTVKYLMRNNPDRSWDRYFSDIAVLISGRSKDQSTQVGSVIVKDNTVISTGYNGFPRGVNDDISERHERPEKYSWTCHAEENAILNAARIGAKTDNTTLYVTPLFPCARCARAIIQAQVKEVIVDAWQVRTDWDKEAQIANEMFQESGVSVRYI
jgi:dCMP deaminase